MTESRLKLFDGNRNKKKKIKPRCNTVIIKSTQNICVKELSNNNYVKIQ